MPALRLTGWKGATGGDVDRRSGRGIGSSAASHYPLGGRVPPAEKEELDEKYVVPSRFLEKHAEKLMRRGIDVGSATDLGSGTHGTAFDVGGGRVLKVTNDKTEARASMVLKGKSLRFVVRVYDVFAFPDGLHYGIVQEKLEPLSEGEVTELLKALKRLNWATIGDPKFGPDSYIGSIGGKSWSRFKEEAVEDSIEDRRNVTEYTLDDLENFKIDMMADELLSVGIKFHDYHPGNLMKRGREYVVTDIGASQSKGGGEIPVLEVGALFGSKSPAFGQQMPHRTAAAQEIIDGSRDALARRGIDVSSARPLGGGVMGIAFDVGGGRVLKVTKDRTEAEASFKIKGQNLKHVVRIYDVFQFPDKRHYGIVQEKLEPLSQQEKKFLDTAARTSNIRSSLTNANYDWDKAVDLALDMVSDEDERAKLELRLGVLEDRFGVKDIVDELMSHGVGFMDIHGGNIMKRGDDYVAIDLGISKVKDPQQPGALEGLVREDLEDAGGGDVISQTLQMNTERIRKKYGVDVGTARELGRGQMGVAFDVGGGRVLKVTTDKTEAKAANAVRGKTLKHVVEVYNVFWFKHAPEGVELFGVLQEKLAPLSADEQRDFRDAISLIRDEGLGGELLGVMASGDWERFREALGKKVLEDAESEFSQTGGSMSANANPEIRQKKVKQNAVRRFTHIESGLKRFSVPEMMADLKGAGVQFADYHEGNVMKRGADYVVVDLGKSKSAGPDPEALEGVVTELSMPSGPTSSVAGNSFRGGMGAHHVGRKADTSPWSSPNHAMARLQDVDDEEENERLRDL